jgi:hypothetical protein
MFGNHHYGGLPYGDANPGPSDVTVSPEAISITAAAQPPAVAIDAVVFPTPVSISASAQAPAVAIDVVEFPPEFSVSAVAMHTAVYAPLPIERFRDMPRAEPVCLVEIELKNSGPVLYFSDRAVSAMGQDYEDYLVEITGLTAGDNISTAATVSFKNDRFGPYESLIDIAEDYPFEGAAITVKEVYLDVDGEASEVVTILKGTLAAPRDIDLMGFSCEARPLAHSKDRQWKQQVVDTASWPNAHEDLGEVEPFVYGSDVVVPALRVDWGTRTTLQAKTTASATSLALSDGSRFPSSDFALWIDDEKIHVTTRTGNSCTGLTRGYGGTTATSHRAGADVAEARSQYDSLIAGHELHTVGNVFAEIRGRLWRVTSGVSAVLSGGKHLLRATDHIRVAAIEDGVGINHSDTGTTTAEKNTVQPGTPGSSFTLTNVGDTGTFATFPSAAGANLYEYDLGYNFVMSYSLLTKFVVEAYPTGYPGDAVDVIDADGSTGLMTSMTTLKSPNHATSITFRVKTDQGTNTSCTVYPLRADRKYLTTGGFTGAGSASRTGGVYATHTVERFHAEVSGFKDPDGNYGGTGNLIERPDWVIKHFLVERMGFSLEDIDAASFSAAGSEYASSGYAFAFRVGRKITPSELAKRMARECRSTLVEVKGKWRLDYLPDAAPSAVRTITSGELAGERSAFKFSRTPVSELSNDLPARFRRNYSRLGGDSAWDATASDSDAASQTKYGLYPEEVDFALIRNSSMASDVLAHLLLRGKAPRLTVEFPVFWEHFSLEPGDTIEIENPLYDGRKFLIESIRRPDKFRAVIRATEWWS